MVRDCSGLISQSQKAQNIYNVVTKARLNALLSPAILLEVCHSGQDFCSVLKSIKQQIMSSIAPESKI